MSKYNDSIDSQQVDSMNSSFSSSELIETGVHVNKTNGVRMLVMVVRD